MHDVLCDTAERLEACLRHAATKRVVAVDVEGYDLGRTVERGSRRGKVGLIQMCGDDFVHLYDVVALEALGIDFMAAGLRNILEDRRVVKVMFGSPNDVDALLGQYGVRVRGVHDLQVWHIVQAGKSVLARGVAPSLVSLKHYLRINKIVSEAKAKVGDMMRGSSAFWLARPLSSDALAYAKEDVLHLFKLHAAKLGNRRQWARIAQYSEAYSQVRAEVKDDAVAAGPYHQHGFLPLGIYPLPKPDDERKTCCSCQRTIPCTGFDHGAASCKLCVHIDRMPRRNTRACAPRRGSERVPSRLYAAGHDLQGW